MRSVRPAAPPPSPPPPRDAPPGGVCATPLPPAGAGPRPPRRPAGAAPRSAGPMIGGRPAGDSGAPAAIAPAAVYLGSDESTFVQGTVIDVDGGRANIAVI